jgi:hypothetical protein
MLYSRGRNAEVCFSSAWLKECSKGLQGGKLLPGGLMPTEDTAASWTRRSQARSAISESAVWIGLLANGRRQKLSSVGEADAPTHRLHPGHLRVG